MGQDSELRAVVPLASPNSEEAEWDLHEVWRRYHEEADPKFFRKLDVAEDGGFVEVHCLFDPHRFFWAPVTIASLMMNFGFVVVYNIWNLSQIPISEWVTETAVGTQRWLLINQFIGVLAGGKRINADVLLVFLELIMFMYYLGKAVLAVARVCLCTGSPRWRSVAEIFWDLIPELSVVSAMRSLNFVTPSVLSRDAAQFGMRVWNEDKPNYRADCVSVFLFIAGRTIHFLVGFEAFMIKFSIAAKSVRSATDEFSALLASLAFLNQVLGIVNLHKFSHRQLLLFIFGGEDGFLSEHEEQIASTWLGMLAERMWRAAGQRRPRSAWFLSLALTYTDQDFQKLVLNEEAKRKHRMTQSTQKTSAEMLGSTIGVAVRVESPRGGGEL